MRLVFRRSFSDLAAQRRVRRLVGYLTGFISDH